MDSKETEIEKLLVDAQNYQVGTTVIADMKKAFDLYQKASNKGSPKATAMLGYFYDHGIHVIQNQQIALDFYYKAAKAGDPVAQYNYAAHEYDNENYSEALKWLLESSRQGYNTAVVFIGTLYQRGHGVERSDETAAQYYRKAASENHPDGLFRLALCYRDGRGVQEDHSQMLELVKLAASLNHARALFELGNMYENEREQSGPPHQTSREYYVKAADLGLTEAQQLCGEIFGLGLDCEPDPERAISWLESAIQAGNQRAKYIMAIMFARGLGLTKNLERAFQLCQEAAGQGDSGAQRMLGLLYLKGEGVAPDPQLAQYWTEQAANSFRRLG